MQGDKSRPAVVYKITNTANGKFYIGITTRKNPWVRVREHYCFANMSQKNQGAMARAMRKYPRKVFSVEILEHHITAISALEAEVRLIAELRPHYNSTEGGMGRKGGGATHFTPEGAKKVGLAARTRPHHPMLGKTHGAETRELLRQHGFANIDLFRQFSHMGPKAISRPVICLETGERFESASAAARWAGVPKSMVIELCNRGNPHRKSAGGHKFAYVTSAVA